MGSTAWGIWAFCVLMLLCPAYFAGIVASFGKPWDTSCQMKKPSNGPSKYLTSAYHGDGTPLGQSLPAAWWPTPHCETTSQASVGCHQDEHAGRHQCSLCSKDFTQKSSLLRHLSIHSGDRPHRCDYCNSRFVRRSHLVRHLFTHTGDRPYHCSYCNSSFGRREILDKHIQTHTGERPYQCQLCPMTFAQNHHLVRHVQAHKGEKPYHCRYCQAAFHEKCRLECHEKQKHEMETVTF
ncbi:uncharacterized protein LOC144132965 [Amblyomma americanum]